MKGNRIPPLALAGGLTGLLAAFSLIPWVNANPRLAGSIWAAAAALLVLLVLVRHRAARAGRVLSYTVVPKPVHYVQLTMHTSIYLYWDGTGARSSLRAADCRPIVFCMSSTCWCAGPAR
jgi:hypothetical protein